MLSKIKLYVCVKVAQLLNRIGLSFLLLTYDIETAHLKFRGWRLGEQRVGHDQLLPNANKFRILTISYKWWHEDKVHTLTCGEDGSGQKEMIAKFDAEIRKARVVFGKNNNNFDDKYINTVRLLEDGDPMPEWAYKSDDLEKQLRRYFNFPSFALDYVSDLFGLGGKVKMERKDWVHIEDLIELRQVEKFIKTKHLDDYCQYYFKKSYSDTVKLGREAFKKMIFYNQKDITDTEYLLNKALPHVQLRNNAAAGGGPNQFTAPFASPFSCVTCGSADVTRMRENNKVKVSYRGQQVRVEFHCNNHNGYAGSRPAKRKPCGNWKYTGPMGK